jgi:hypothetical protein
MTQQLTPNYALPYYQGSDLADGATQQQALAQKVDTVLLQKATSPMSGLYAARPAPNSVAAGTVYIGTDAGSAAGIWMSNGSFWLTLAKPQLTVLPSSPAHGDEIIFSSPLAPHYPHWHLRYDTGYGDTSKWAFVGGPMMEKSISAAYVNSGPTGSWIDPPDGPTLTPPLPGVYEVAVGSQMSAVPNVAFSWSARAGQGGAQVTDGVQFAGASGGGASISASPSSIEQATLTTGVLGFQTFIAGTSGSFAARYLGIRPVRLG